ncbi:MAG: MBL fold metallo-hydrolase [Bdellovibrionota bacterium]
MGARLKISILGSGTSTGVPTIACDCAVCSSPEAKNKRMRSSILITNLDTNEHLVVDTTPDFRMQMINHKVKRLNHVLYTHTHADHCHGFDDLRAFYFGPKLPIHCWLVKGQIPELKKRFDYAFNSTGYSGVIPTIELHEIPMSGPFNIIGLPIEAISLEHGHVLTTAFKIGSFAYATDFKRFNDRQIAHWRGTISHMVASGLRFREHPTHSSVDETLALFEKLQVKRGVITHLSHEVDFHRDSSKLPPNAEFAYDGLSFEVEI